MNAHTERTAHLRRGEARYTVTVTPVNGAPFTTTVRGYSVEQAGGRALAFYMAREVRVCPALA